MFERVESLTVCPSLRKPLASAKGIGAGKTLIYRGGDI